jgi:GNAT superfamily N-acetyltransferase
MKIRNATYHDAPDIKMLLEILGYKTTTSILINQLEAMFDKDDHQVFVYELRKEIIGFVSVHFMTQLAFDGGLVFISYLSVKEELKDQGVATALEQFVVEWAKKRKCDRIQVHCMDWRAPAHQFYIQQGYQGYPKYFSKRLIYGD